MSPHHIRSLTLAVTACVALYGCGSDSSDEDSTQESKSAGSTFPQELIGNYSRNVSKADIERTAEQRSEVGPNQETPPPGRRILTITDSKASMKAPAEKPPFVVDQAISATAGGKLVFLRYLNPTVGSFCGPEISQSAEWSWRRDGEILVLRAVDEDCADRDTDLAGSWKPVK